MYIHDGACILYAHVRTVTTSICTVHIHVLERADPVHTTESRLKAFKSAQKSRSRTIHICCFMLHKHAQTGTTERANVRSTTKRVFRSPFSTVQMSTAAFRCVCCLQRLQDVDQLYDLGCHAIEGAERHQVCANCAPAYPLNPRSRNFLRVIFVFSGEVIG